MQVYIIMNQLDAEACDILGVFTEYEQAKRHWSEYVAENPAVQCWIETHDADVWLHEAQQEYRIIHKTMVSKNMGMISHTVSVSAEEMPVSMVEEGQGWYVVCQEISTFDEEEGRKKNLQLLETYKKEQ